MSSRTCANVLFISLGLCAAQEPKSQICLDFPLAGRPKLGGLQDELVTREI